MLFTNSASSAAIEILLGFEGIAGDPNFGYLTLTPQDFGYASAADVPANVNYYQSNLIGAKREYIGLDFDLQKRFKDGHLAAIQYSFKDSEGNILGLAENPM
jgi:hypothetical protein